MIKVGVKKSIGKKSIPLQTNKTEKILVENFVSLQKVMVNLSENFTNLSSQISKLLKLFESSAKTLVEKGFEDNQEIVKKLDSLIDQNKTIARGVALLHETEEEHEMPRPLPIPKPMPMIPKPNIPPMQKPKIIQNPPTPPQEGQQPSINMQEYQKSISSP